MNHAKLVTYPTFVFGVAVEPCALTIANMAVGTLPSKTNRHCMSLQVRVNINKQVC